MVLERSSRPTDLPPTPPPDPGALGAEPTEPAGPRPPEPPARSGWARHLGTRLLVTVVVGWLAAGVALTFLQRSIVYLPDDEVPPAEDVLPGARAVAYVTEDGLVLGGWWLPAAGRATADGATADGATAGRATAGGAAADGGRRPAPAVIVFHGIGGNRVGMAPLARGLSERGASVLLAEYRGYGGAPGVPTEEGLARDARAAARWVRSRPDVDPARVVYLGDSLGTGVATTLAVDDPPALLVLRSPFTSLPDVATSELPIYPYGWLMWDRYATIDRIARVDAPVLVAVAGDDELVPPDQSRAVAAAARRPDGLLTFPAASHIDPEFLVGPTYLDAIAAALARHAG